VHVGTLLAVIIYFWRDIAAMLGGLGQLARGRRDAGGLLAVHVVIATVPVIAAGYALNEFGQDALRRADIIAWATLGFAIVLYLADRFCLTVRRLEHLRYGGALTIGLFQVLALIPGTSRSGITMTAARLLGMERSDAARFSMVISIPVILGAGLLKGFELYQSADQVMTLAAVYAALIAFIFAVLTIAALMAWLKRASFTPFVIYRVLLGLGLLYFVYFVPGFAG
jgi:undecaprenyl-diphosphatase